MEIDWYDDVLLKDGREGCVIEIYSGDNIETGYEIELSSEPDNSETITVTSKDIEKVIRKNKI